MSSHLKKIIFSIFGAAIILFAPNFSYAVPTFDPGSAATAAATTASAAANTVSAAADQAMVTKEYVLDTIATAMAKSLMQQITKSTVKWIQNGFQGQPFIPEDYQKWAQDAGDKAGGLFLDKLTNGGFSQFCSNPSWNIGLSLPRAEPFEIQTKCTLSEFGNNWQRAYNSAAQGDWSAWIQISRPENNPYGQFLLSWEEQNRIKDTAKTKEQTDLTLNKGVLSMREHSSEADPVCVDSCQRQDELARGGPWYNDAYLADCIQSCVDAGSEKTTTPGAIINDQLTQSLGGGWARLQAADELNEVIGALIDYSLNQMRNGLVQHFAAGKSISTSPSYTGGNLYGVFSKTYTLEDVKADIFQMKYALYDGKILSYDAGFKPGFDYDPINNRCKEGSANCDAEARDIYTNLYTQLKGDRAFYDTNCQLENPDDRLDPQSVIKHPSGNVWDKGFWDRNCGILAYNTFRNKRAPNDIIYAGFDMVKRSTGLASPQSQALIWYRKFDLKRLSVMFSELIDARTQAAGDASKVRCQYRDQRDLDFDTAKNIINRDAEQLRNDINDIEGYYGINGTYDNLLSLIKEAEDAANSLNILDANASTTVQNIAENLLTLKTRMPSISEKITKRFDDMGYYAKGSSCDGANFTATTVDGQTYGYGELGCMAKAEALKNAALRANPSAAFSKQDIQKFNNLSVGDSSDANMHCWVQGALYDTYGTWTGATQNSKDTCNGDSNNPYTCAQNDAITSCTDVASSITATATGGSGGGQNQGGSGGSSSVGSNYSARTVSCVLGAGIDPNAGSGGGTGGPDKKCADGPNTAPLVPNSGANYYSAANCTSRALCDQYYNGNTDCYFDLYFITKFGGSEKDAIDNLNLACWGQNSAAWGSEYDGNYSHFNADSYYNKHPSERYGCLQKQAF